MPTDDLTEDATEHMPAQQLAGLLWRPEDRGARRPPRVPAGPVPPSRPNEVVASEVLERFPRPGRNAPLRNSSDLFHVKRLLAMSIGLALGVGSMGWIAGWLAGWWT